MVMRLGSSREPITQALDHLTSENRGLLSRHFRDPSTASQELQPSKSLENERPQQLQAP